MEVQAMLIRKERKGRSNLMLCFVAAMCLTSLTDSVAQGSQALEWNRASDSITITGNQLEYSGTPTGWRSNSASTDDLLNFGFQDNYEVSFSIDSDPATSLWVVGLYPGRTDWWRFWYHLLRNSNGQLMVYEGDEWRTSGPLLSQGDIISMKLSGGVIEYRHNGNVIYSSTYADSTYFQVNASFKNGAATIGASVRSVNAPPPPPPSSGTVPITDWVSAIGSVTTSGNTVIFPGTSSTAWVNSVNSRPFSALGAEDDYEVSWTVDNDPANGIWVVGLGIRELRSNWRDVDFAFRNSNGFLTIHKAGVFTKDVGSLVIGDVLSIHVTGSELVFTLNGSFVYSTEVYGDNDFYIDTAFKGGASTLSFLLTVDETPPPTGVPITSWVGEVGGVSTSGDSVSYSGSPTGWINSVNSALLSSLGATGDYTVSFTVNSDPLSSHWVMGLGLTESGSSWSDIDVALRNMNGSVHLYFDGVYRYQGKHYLSIGDEVSFSVSGRCVSVRINGSGISSHCRTGRDPSQFYIDSAFKNGATDLSGFTFTNE